MNLNCKQILGLTEIKFFFDVNGVVTKLKYFSYVNARMAQSILCNFDRRGGPLNVYSMVKCLKHEWARLFLPNALIV